MVSATQVEKEEVTEAMEGKKEGTERKSTAMEEFKVYSNIFNLFV